MWTQFMDMHSGGSSKLDWQYIYIEAPRVEAEVIFYNRFGRNPNCVTCSCCGADYSISSEESLAQLTGYERGCDSGYVMPDGSIEGEDWWYSLPREERASANASFRYLERPSTRYSYREFCTLEDYMKRADVTFIPASHIKDEERHGSVPDQGYVWV
jgi:hypothetical protein